MPIRIYAAMIALLLTGTARSAAADDDSSQTVTITKLSFSNLPPPEIDQLLSAMTRRLEYARVRVKSKAAIDQALKSSPELFTDECLGDERCWTQAANALITDMILSGSVARDAGGYRATLSLFAKDIGRFVRREQVECPRCSLQTFVDRVCDTVFELVKANGQERGTLAVRSEPPGADVRIDGRPAGKTPVEITEVAGTHEVVASATGRVDGRSAVELKPRSRIEVVLELKPIAVAAPVIVAAKPEPWSAHKLNIAGWSVVAASVVGIVIGGALLGINGHEIGRHTDGNGVLVADRYETTGVGGAIIGIGMAIGCISAAPFYYAKKKQSAGVRATAQGLRVTW